MSDNIQIEPKFKLDDIEALKKSKELPLLMYSKINADTPVESDITLEDFEGFQLKPYKNFGEVNLEILAFIRLKIAANDIDENIENWCEKLLRYCEIRYSSLKKRAAAQGRTQEEITKVYNQVVALFIEYYLGRGDLRFFNTALKLMDRKWLKSPKIFNKKYKATQALYQCNTLLINKVLNDIENG